jgi:hypothetical protein
MSRAALISRHVHATTVECIMSSLRRSSRLQAAQGTPASSEELSSTSVKRRKTGGTDGGATNTKSVPKAKKGARTRWDQLPLDVLYEV